jgi:hypothetical protein
MKQAEERALPIGEEAGPALIFEDHDGIRWRSLDVNDALELALLGR